MTTEQATTEQATVAEAKAQAETRTAAPPVVPDAEDAPPTPTEPSPAQTPLVPPPGRAEGTAAALEPPPLETVPTPAATPTTETLPLPPEPFADELPPDFWEDALEPPSPPPTPSEPPDTLASAPSPTALGNPTTAPAPSSGTAKPLEGSLQKDPRFVLLQELFPGRISDWHAAPVASDSETGENGIDGAADALIDPETVDLEEGLDADETVS